MRPDTPRDPLAGPDSGPESPYPIRLSGPVIKGFGRGSKELGIPTANIPADGLSEHPDLESGVYYGVAALEPSRFQPTDAEIQKDQPSNETTILPCVLSIGYNPFYKNTVRSVEIHILPHLSLQSSPSASPLSSTPTTPDPTSSPGDNSASKPPHTRHHFHHFPDFYGTPLNLLILGYIRPEYDYVSLEALVEDIRVDCEVAKRSLARRKYICFIQEGGDVDDEGTKEARKWLRTF
ncbi:riboflavin kinase [Coccidioides immitis RS]|uniref:Riboflavin kinase n=1 Tax=Coccidioides immitis (strain RS) TaxID=246410 RepID=J3KI85_COCIM|nr:riboflavin kinase [Coccidioides immitis RS]EAS35658.3 riboflavin kinase [Coccidioides immitis RS]TPX26119.1 riboflavin kinase [Coccidioides immitis]